MLYDHSGLPYAVALERCAEHTRNKFKQILTKGQQQLPDALAKLEQVPDDAIVKSRYLDLVMDETDKRLKAGEMHDWKLHDHAWTQICAKTGFPEKYGQKLEDTDWGRELIAENINVIFANSPERRFLIRSINGQARGFLSDRYRRLDMRPIMDNLFDVAKQHGAVVLEALVSDVKGEIKFGYPQILEPIPGEPMLYWVSARASDYGDSKILIRYGVCRAVCTNFATIEETFSQVHLGKQLPDNIVISEETYRKDTELIVSLTRDAMKTAFMPERVSALIESIKKADQVAAPTNLAAAMKSLGMRKNEIEAAMMLYNQPDIEVLPKGDSMWRFSNAVSFMAHSAPNEDRKLELQDMAGELLRNFHRKTGQQVLEEVA